MGGEDPDIHNPLRVEYESRVHAPGISPWSALLGVGAAWMLVILGILTTGTLVSVAWEATGSNRLTVIVGVAVAGAYLVFILWLASHFRRKGNPGLALGIYIGLGLMMLISGACFVGVIK